MVTYSLPFLRCTAAGSAIISHQPVPILHTDFPKTFASDMQACGSRRDTIKFLPLPWFSYSREERYVPSGRRPCDRRLRLTDEAEGVRIVQLCTSGGFEQM